MRCLCALAGLLVLEAVAPLGDAAGQHQFIAPGISARLGIERSASQDGGATAIAPFMVDASVRLWTDEAVRVAFGGSFRAEVSSAGTAVGIVPRLELRHALGEVELRPGVALPFFFAPLTMLGPELSAGVRYPLTPDFGLIADLALAAFIVGNNVPKDTTLIQLTGGIGVDLLL